MHAFSVLPLGVVHGGAHVTILRVAGQAPAWQQLVILTVLGTLDAFGVLHHWSVHRAGGPRAPQGGEQKARGLGRRGRLLHRQCRVSTFTFTPSLLGCWPKELLGAIGG